MGLSLVTGVSATWAATLVIVTVAITSNNVPTRVQNAFIVINFSGDVS